MQKSWFFAQNRPSLHPQRVTFQKKECCGEDICTKSVIFAIGNKIHI